MVILVVPAEGRLTKVSRLLGSPGGWMVELALDKDHLKPKECLTLLDYSISLTEEQLHI